MPASYFFFQAEDGIRDKLVTGVQTCALPIYRRYQSMMASRNTNTTAAPMARNTTNGTWRFLPRSRSGTYTRLPNTDAANTVSSTPFQPTNAPTIAIILISPPPIASSPKTHRPATPTAYSSAKPVAAPSTASLNPGTPAVREAPSPMIRPAQLYSSGIR